MDEMENDKNIIDLVSTAQGSQRVLKDGANSEFSGAR